MLSVIIFLRQWNQILELKFVRKTYNCWISIWRTVANINKQTCAIYTLINGFLRKMTKVLFLGFRSRLEALKRFVDLEVDVSYL